jgi:DNA polymerase-1
MNREAVFVETIDQLIAARDEILKYDVIGVDTETTGLSAIKDELRLLQLSVSPSIGFVFDMRKLNGPSLFKFFKDILADPKKVVCFQNAKFDLQFITAFFNEGPLAVELLYDTMLASKILSFERRRTTQKNGKSTWLDVNKHSLAEIVRRELDVVLDKELQKSDFSREISQAQIEYASRDARVLHNVRRVQKAKIISHGLQKVVRLEGDAVAAIADLEYNGIYLDKDDWTSRIDRQQSRADELRSTILEALAPHVEQVDLFGEPVVNIDSPAQLLPLLRRFGVPIGESTSEDELRPFMSDYPLVEILMEYRENATALKKFGTAYFKFVDGDDRIHADFHQMTAPSGRMSCSNPNLQQITQDPEYRRPFKAQNGGKIISADYGQIELRIMAVQSRDPGLVKAFIENIHIHKQTCNLVFGEPLDNPEPRKYRLSKNLNFGATYGAGPPRFAQVAGIREDEAQEALRLFWRAYPVLDKYMERRGLECAETGVTRTHSGRMVKLLYDHQDRSAFGSAKRLGRNFGIQGTGADILKRAIYKMRNKAIAEKVDMRLINLVHDETVTETDDDAEKVGSMVRDAMVEAGQEVLEDIPCIVDLHIDNNWTK